jgi:2-C-methyl-D-erythritol 4-phosphate cytidylyltransferase
LGVTAVIAAAGSGERLGAGGPKAFVPLAGRPMVEWSIEAFREVEGVHSIVVAVPPGLEEGVWDEQMPGGGGAGAVEGGGLGVVEGGATRAESVSHALEVVGTELVAIHDAARPLVTPELIEGVVAVLVADPDASGAIAATRVTDTIKQVRTEFGEAEPKHPPDSPRCNAKDTHELSNALHQGEAREARPGCNAKDMHELSNALHRVEETVDRGRLWGAQTPQVFRVAALRAALAADPERVAAATDEAMLVEAAGGRVLIHPASPENLKVTTALDLKVAESLLAAR